MILERFLIGLVIAVCAAVLLLVAGLLLSPFAVIIWATLTTIF